MKKVLLLLVAISSAFVSCSDDDSQIVETSPIHGKWEVKSFSAEATINDVPVPEEDLDFNNVVGTTFEFKPEGKFLVTSYDDFDGKWVTDEGTYVYHSAQNKVEYTMFDSDGSSYTEEMSVKLLTNTSFNFTIATEEVDDGDVFKLSMDINCEKVN